jgi:(p)ppGpp synthase/HD superfamily hydrolase
MAGLEPNLPALARELAIAAHHGQTRRDGEAYINHVARVAATVAGLSREHIVVAWLHDVIEDTDVSARAITVLFGAEISRDVCALTRAPHLSSHATYASYIADLIKFGSPRALQVKLADLADHMECARRGGKPPRKRYVLADQAIRARLAHLYVYPGL